MNTRITLVCSTAAVALLSGAPVRAQSTDTATPAALADTPAEPAIVVTGMRASLERAQAVKQKSTSVVEALAAEDIGKLPQSSVADSLGRLSGPANARRPHERHLGARLPRGFRRHHHERA
jgi:iron complex outermembrane receptor protein